MSEKMNHEEFVRKAVVSLRKGVIKGYILFIQVLTRPSKSILLTRESCRRQPNKLSQEGKDCYKAW